MGCCNSKDGDVLEPERHKPNDQPTTADSSKPQCSVVRRTDENGKRGSVRASASPSPGPAQETGAPGKRETAPLATSLACSGSGIKKAPKADIVCHSLKTEALHPSWPLAGKSNAAVKPEHKSALRERLESFASSQKHEQAAAARKDGPRQAAPAVKPSAAADVPATKASSYPPVPQPEQGAAAVAPAPVAMAEICLDKEVERAVSDDISTIPVSTLSTNLAALPTSLPNPTAPATPSAPAAENATPAAAVPATPAAPAAASAAEAPVPLTNTMAAAQPADAAVAPPATCGGQAANEPAAAPAVKAADAAAAKPPLLPRKPAAAEVSAGKPEPAVKQPAVSADKKGCAFKVPRPPRVPPAKAPAPTLAPVPPRIEASKVQAVTTQLKQTRTGTAKPAQAQPPSPLTARADSCPGLPRPDADVIKTAAALRTSISEPQVGFPATKTPTEVGSQAPAPAAVSETHKAAAPPAAETSTDAAIAARSGVNKPAPAKPDAESHAARQSIAQGKPLGQPPVGPSKAVCARKGAAAAKQPVTQPAVPAAVTGISVSADPRPGNLERVLDTTAAASPFGQPSAAAAAAVAMAEAGKADTTTQTSHDKANAGPLAAAAAATQKSIEEAASAAFFLLDSNGFAHATDLAAGLVSALLSLTESSDMGALRDTLDLVVGLREEDSLDGTAQGEYKALLAGLRNYGKMTMGGSVTDGDMAQVFPPPEAMRTSLDADVERFLSGALTPEGPTHARGLRNYEWNPNTRKFDDCVQICFANSTLQVVARLPGLARLAKAPLCKSSQYTTLGALLRQTKALLFSPGQAADWLDKNRLLCGLTWPFEVRCQDDPADYLNSLFQTTGMDHAGYKLVKHYIGGSVIQTDKWRYQGVDHSETSPVAALTVENPLLTLAITCEEADAALNNGSVELTSLEACLDYYTRERPNAEFAVHDATGKKKPGYAERATTQARFHQAPRVLGIRLGRFGFDKDAKETFKLLHAVSYPHEFDLTPYMNNASKRVTYKLHSVIRHWGPTKERGHYTACVQNQDGTWLHANDEDMIPCTSDEVLQDDPVWAGTAYILMYVLDTA